MSSGTVSDLAARYAEVCARVQSATDGRAKADGRPVTLVAVSKTVEPARIEELYRLGHRDFGENYAQELVAKAMAFAERGIADIRWHFIGHLQTNKVKSVIPFVHAVHAVDSSRLGRELAKRWREAGHAEQRLQIFVEVNIDAEEGKAGVAPSEAPALVRELASLEELDLRGLMCVPRPRDLATESAELRAKFAELRELNRQCGGAGDLSMGMSGDFELAIAEGATHVRVGTALFGARSEVPQ